MSVTCYFIMIHQVIVMCLYEEGGGSFLAFWAVLHKLMKVQIQ